MKQEKEEGQISVSDFDKFVSRILQVPSMPKKKSKAGRTTRKKKSKQAN